LKDKSLIINNNDNEIIDVLCDSYLYDEYHEIKNEVEQYAK